MGASNSREEREREGLVVASKKHDRREFHNPRTLTKQYRFNATHSLLHPCSNFPLQIVMYAYVGRTTSLNIITEDTTRIYLWVLE